MSIVPIESFRNSHDFHGIRRSTTHIRQPPAGQVRATTSSTVTRVSNYATTKRLNVNLTERASKELEELALRVGSTKTELVKNALGLMKIVIREMEDEGRFVVVCADGKIKKEIIFPF